MWKAFSIFIFLTITAPASHPQGTPESSPAIQQITTRIREINRAYESRDHRPFEKYYADGYINIRNKVVYNVREQLIAMLRSDSHVIRAGKKPDHITRSFKAEDPEIRIYGNIAVVDSVKFHEWEYRGSSCVTRFVATDVWVYEEAGWKLAAGAANTFHCDPLPWSRPHPAVAELEDRTAISDPASAALTGSIGSAMENLARVGSGGRLMPGARYVDVEGNGGKDFDTFFELLKAANDPAQRLMIDEEGFHSLKGGAIYTFRSKKRGARGFIDRASITQHFVLFIDDGGVLKTAAAHSISTVAVD